MILTIIIIVILVLIVYIISTSNELNKAKIKIEEAESDIDVALTKRYDVLTKMVAVVKNYMKHEQETIFKIIELRKNMTMQEKNEANSEMDQQVTKINVLAENYPELKANENFQILQKSILEVEEHLQASRRLYNANVSSYNQKIVLFPSNIIAKLKGLNKKEFFEIEAKKHENVKMEL